MSAAMKLPPHPMTVTEFLAWAEAEGSGQRWQLRDGEPEAMAPPSDRHGSIQIALGAALFAHLQPQRRCRVVGTPGVIPKLRSERNMLSPDLAVTCVPPNGAHAVAEPAVLIEILSPTNARQTRANIVAYSTIPSVREIALLHSERVFAELWRRAEDGTWPAEPEIVDTDGTLRFATIDFAVPLRDAYATTALASPTG